MKYGLSIKKGKGRFILTNRFKTKTMAKKRAKFFRQMDDDLPKSSRHQNLKTIKVIKITKLRRR